MDLLVYLGCLLYGVLIKVTHEIKSERLIRTHSVNMSEGQFSCLLLRNVPTLLKPQFVSFGQ